MILQQKIFILVPEPINRVTTEHYQNFKSAAPWRIRMRVRRFLRPVIYHLSHGYCLMDNFCTTLSRETCVLLKNYFLEWTVLKMLWLVEECLFRSEDDRGSNPLLRTSSPKQLLDSEKLNFNRIILAQGCFERPVQCLSTVLLFYVDQLDRLFLLQ